MSRRPASVDALDLVGAGPRPGRPRGGPRPACGFPGCDQPSRARGLCRGHYMQHHRGRELAPLWETQDRRPVEVPAPPPPPPPKFDPAAEEIELLVAVDALCRRTGKPAAGPLDVLDVLRGLGWQRKGAG